MREAVAYPPAFIVGNNRSLSRFKPSVFTRIAVSAGSVAATPALLNRISTGWASSALICATAASIDMGLPISVSMNSSTLASGYLTSSTIVWSAPAARSSSTNAAPVMGRGDGGAIVAVSSIAGHLTHRNAGQYCVAKAGVEMLVRNAADELGRYGIRVNGVRPGLVPTEMAAGLAQTDAIREEYLAQMPLGRLGKPEDVAGAVRFLAGPEASWIAGQLLGVDGGHSLRRGPDLDPLFAATTQPQMDEIMGIG